MNDQQAVVHELEARIAELSEALAETKQQAQHHITHLQNNLQETQLVSDISRQLVAATHLEQIYTALVEGVMKRGVDRCVLYMCNDLDTKDIPKYGEVVFVRDVSAVVDKIEEVRIPLVEYPLLYQLVQTKTSLIILDTTIDQTLSLADRAYLSEFNIISLVIVPLVVRHRIIGFLFIGYRSQHHFTDHELSLYYTLCNQTTVAIDNTHQHQQTQVALAETQTLYRAGRVLAGATNLEEILQESLIEFLYSLGLDQGGITLLSPDRQQGELVAYVQNGQVQDIETLKFDIGADIPYQQVLLSGRTFTSYDVANDSQLKNYKNFNTEVDAKSLLEAPMIINGETIGWVGADSVKRHRKFSAREIDLARAMADQIAITIQNRRLLEKSERQTEQLKAVARVGKAVSEMIDLDEMLSSTVDLIRDQFGFYHVSIFLLDEARKWAVVRASTGEVGKILVEGPHRLAVGGQSIVGYVTGKAESRIALDVGQDKVHFNNPLLPNTRSEMALPMIARGKVVGALDVQSVEAHAFSRDDVDTLQIMTDQLTAALENARLFQAAQDSETFVKAIIDQIPDPIFIKDREHRWIVVNKAFCNILGLPEEKVIGASDYDYLPKKDVDIYREQDDKVFYTGQISEIEGTILHHSGEERLTYTRKIPLTLKKEQVLPDYLIGVINDITEQRQREAEREQLIEDTARNLARTQSLYRISHALSTATTQSIQTAFETVLGEHLRLLNLQQGSLMFFDRPTNTLQARVRYIDGVAVPPNFSLPVEDDLVFQHLQKKPTPLIIQDAPNHPLIKSSTQTRGKAKAMLFIPLIVREKVIGTIVADATDPHHIFSPSDIEMGEAIADQLGVRLESWNLLNEAQHKSTLLQTAAEVSRAASSMLDVDELINNSVNLIWDKFGLYYVGLFMVDEDRKWAILRAGTGEAGRLQIEAGHRLKIGSGSMIGWSIQHRQHKIALDVGVAGENFFRNKYLPDTHSELALPLYSKGEVIGALTVQSVERNAFSDEDITVLQTMADQLANAIANARLFETVARARREAEVRLHESIAMQQFSQTLASTLYVNEILEMFFQACTKIIGFDYVQIALVSQDEVRAVAGVGVSERQLQQARYALDSNDIMAHIVRTGKPETVVGWDDRFDRKIYDQEKHEEWIRYFTPITLRQHHIGVVEAGFKKNQILIEESYTRLLHSFIDQTVLALDNAQRYDLSQRTARREEIIREITGKIRGALNVDEILQTAVTELGHALGAKQGGIRLITDSNSTLVSSTESISHTSKRKN